MWFIFSPQTKSQWDNKSSCAAWLPRRQLSAQRCLQEHILLLTSAAAQRHVLHCRKHRQGQVGQTRAVITGDVKHSFGVNEYEELEISLSADRKLYSLCSLLQLIRELCTPNYCCLQNPPNPPSPPSSPPLPHYSCGFALTFCLLSLLHLGNVLAGHHSLVLLQWSLTLRPCWWSQVLWCSSPVPTCSLKTCLPGGCLRHHNRLQVRTWLQVCVSMCRYTKPWLPFHINPQIN